MVLGHWDLSAEDLSGASDLSSRVGQWLANVAEDSADGRVSARALQGVVTGIRGAAPHSGPSAPLQMRILPFGPATAFAEAVSQDGPASGNFKHIIAGRKEASTLGVGSELRDLGDFNGTVLVEGGHSWSHDWGLGLLGALSGEPLLSSESDPAVLEAAFESAREALAGRTIVASSSTSRPLLGPGGTAFLAPDVSRRQGGADQARFVEVWKTLLDSVHSRTRAIQNAWTLLPSGSEARRELDGFGPATLTRPTSDPAKLQGSGMAGGAGAVLAALGVPIRSTWDTLSTLLNLSKLVNESDLVVAVEPHLDSPNLVDSALRHVGTVAQVRGVPVVAVAAQSSLSGPERADIGVHGVSLLTEGADDPFADVGRRIAQTWLR